jgi:hypothetical protein
MSLPDHPAAGHQDGGMSLPDDGSGSVMHDVGMSLPDHDDGSASVSHE